MGDEEHGKKRKLEQEPAPVKLEDGELPEQPQAKDDIRRLLSPFSREQLIEILTNAYVLTDGWTCPRACIDCYRCCMVSCAVLACVACR